MASKKVQVKEEKKSVSKVSLPGDKGKVGVNAGKQPAAIKKMRVHTPKTNITKAPKPK
jgi:F0F1-type ATP synthase epsilon subunit